MPAEARASYRRQIAAAGEMVTLRRINESGPDTDKQVRARVTGFSPEELAAGIDQGTRKVVALAADVEASGFPVPFETGGSDKVVLSRDGGEQVLNIDDVDDSTRRVGGVLIAYEIKAKG